MNNTVICPDCGAEVSMTAAIENEIRAEEQKKSETKFAQLKATYENENKKREEQSEVRRKNYFDAISKLEEREKAINQREIDLQDVIRIQLKEQTPQLEEKITKSLEEKYKDRLDSATKMANENKLCAEESSKREGDLLVTINELQIKFRQQENDTQRKIVEERDKVYNEGLQKGTTDSKQQILLLENKLDAVTKQFNEAQRKLDQGSQKAQGDVWEKEIGDILQTSFPVDKIEKIQNGTRGGDIVHTVMSPMGKPAGSIVWEVKNTVKWEASWIPKLKEDQRRIGAEFAIIVTRTLPKNANNFIHIDDVIVTDYQTFQVIATFVREAVIGMYKIRTLGVNVEQNLKAIHDYLTSTHFIHLVQKNLECITRMLQELDHEEKVLAKTRGNLRTTLQIMQCSISEMYGELQGILGEKLMNLPEFEEENLSVDEKIYLPESSTKGSEHEILIAPQQNIAEEVEENEEMEEDFPF